MEPWEQLHAKVSSADSLRRLYFGWGTKKKSQTPAEFPRLIFILSGQVSLRLFDGNHFYEQVYSPGDGIFCFDGGVSENLYDSEFESAAIVFPPDHIRIVYYRYTLDRPVPLRGPDLYYLSSYPPNVALLNMIHALTLLATETNPVLRGALHLAEAIRAYALSVLYMSESERAGGAFQTWQRIHRFMLTHPDDRHYRYALAKRFQLTPGYISTLCRTFTGRTLNAYQMTLRLQRVTLLLQETSMTLDEIAMACKFSHTSYLIRVYKKYYGHTPGRGRVQQGGSA